MEPHSNKVSEVTRRDIVDSLLIREKPLHGRLGHMEFLKRVWDLASMPSTDYRCSNLEGDVWMHTVNFPDWSDAELYYDKLDVTQIPDVQFFKFLETIVHPLTRSSEDETDELVELINERLVRDGFALRKSKSMSGRPVFAVVSGSATEPSQYEVVLSFAGEQRDYVEQVAAGLKAMEVSVFYDKYEEASLWGKELTEHLQQVYAGTARYCVIFISQEYRDKVWTTHERRNAFAKALEERHEYVLPARFDDSEIPGLRKTVGYVDLRAKSPADLVALICEKLGRPK